MKRPPAWLFAVPPAVFGMQVCVYRDRLPERMATHFDFAGRPDGWMSRDRFLVFYFGMLVFMTVLFSGIGAIVRHVPTGMVNLPHRDYWLAAERREATIAYVSAATARLGLLVLTFLVAVHELVLRANVAGKNLPAAPMWIGLGALLATVALWLVQFYRRFRRPA
jgi:uncharacterized membrane protein